MPQQPDYDQSLKRLLVRAHDGFLALVAPDLAWRGELSPELPAVARRADLVWEVTDRNGQRGILHIELQTKPDADIGERMAEYVMRLYRQHHLDVRSVVVFLRPAQTVPQPPFVINGLGRRSLEFDFDSIRLWEIPPEQVLETDQYGLWPLAGLMSGVTLERAEQIAKQIGSAAIPRQERAELAGLFVLLAGLRLPRAALARAMWRAGMIEDLWKESSLSGALHDIAERRLLWIALQGRFGSITSDVYEALGSADEATCEAIAAHLTTDTLDQMRARLGLGPATE